MKRRLLVVSSLCLLVVSAAARAQDEDEDAAPSQLRAPDPSAAEAPATKITLPKLNVVRIHFRGNRKVEDDALRVNLKLKPGMNLSKEILQEDVRTIWRLGYFEDIQVETAQAEGGLVVTFVLKEKPTIRKIYISGHDEIGLTKINEVLDLKKEQVLDLAKVKKNVEKIRELYLQRGYYMAEVEYELHRDTPGQVDVYFRVHENSKVEIRRVNFTGNKAVSDDELRSVMLTQPGDIFSALTSSGTYREDVFQRDIMLIQGYYFDRGYINVKVGDPRMELSPDRHSMYITVAIEEGQQYRIGALDVKGELLESRETYLSHLRAKPGEIFNRTEVAQDVQNIADLYKDKGYAYVNSTPETRVDDKHRTVDLSFDIQKGPLVNFERINIRGNTKTRDKVIRREMRIYEGEQYSQTGLDISKRRINSLGFFDKVEVTTKRGSSDDTMDVNVEVGERQTGAFQIGAGFSSVESFIFQAQISQNNFLGRGTSATLQAQVSGLAAALYAPVRGSVLLGHQLDFRIQPVQPAALLPGLHPHVDGWQPDLGLHAGGQSAHVFDLHLAGRWGCHRGAQQPLHGRSTQSVARRIARQPLALRHPVLVAYFRRLRHPRRPHVPAPRLVQHRIRRIRRAGLFLGKPVHALRGGVTLLLPSLGTTHPASQGRGWSHHQPGSAGGAYLRALLHRRHL